MELIIVILFFAIASAICLRLFVGAHLLSEKDKVQPRLAEINREEI